MTSPALPLPEVRPRNLAALIIAPVALAVSFHLIGQEYAFYIGYVVLQYVVLAVAWNILGGYAGYVNFGAGAFFAAGAYTTVFLNTAFGSGLLLCVLAGGVVSGLLGLGMGYLTLRLRGVYFAIATLSLAVVLQTLVVNWPYVGGSSGAYVMRPRTAGLFLNYGEILFIVMLAVTVTAIGTAMAIERSTLGLGLTTIRDDERAAAAASVPTLRLKLIATVLSGCLMGMAGAPLPYYSSYIDPDSAFSLTYSVNAMAMPLIGGTQTWLGPVIGAVLLASMQQIVTVTISSSANLLIIGGMLVGFVVLAPNGILGLVASLRRGRAP